MRGPARGNTVLAMKAGDLVGAALRGPDRHLAVGGDGPTLRYRPDVAAFASLGPDPDEAAWIALAQLPGDRSALLSDDPVIVPATWVKLREMSVLLMSGRGVETPAQDSEIVQLGDEDVAEMLDLVARTSPGPFLARTIDFGGYLGIRRDGVLAAMAGRRLHPPGWIEVSAVCTDPAYRGLGLAQRVTAAVVSRTRDDGSQAFLHVLPSNPARRLYESLGFVVSRQSLITVVERVG
jgi:ribosomal protein S18 acetylase RimI-like enzyme